MHDERHPVGFRQGHQRAAEFPAVFASQHLIERQWRWIGDLQRVLISYGPETDDQVRAQFAQVDDDACIPSERCGERIGPNEQKEQCHGTGACTKPGG